MLRIGLVDREQNLNSLFKITVAYVFLINADVLYALISWKPTEMDQKERKRHNNTLEFTPRTQFYKILGCIRRVSQAIFYEVFFVINIMKMLFTM